MRNNYRMYGFVPYNISELQKGIQFGHAVVEYSNQFKDFTDYIEWSTLNKTFIILNGGTTNTSPISLGGMNIILEQIKKQGIKYATFFEEDLGNQLTAIVFLVDQDTYLYDKGYHKDEVDYNDRFRVVDTTDKTFFRSLLMDKKLA